MTDFKLWDFEIFIKMYIVIVRRCSMRSSMTACKNFDSDVSVMKDMRKLEVANKLTSLFLLWYFFSLEVSLMNSNLSAIKLIIGKTKKRISLT